MPIQTQISTQQLSEQLDGFLDERTRLDKFSGAVLVASADQILFKKAYGLASKRYSIPNRVDTKFNLGSMNKMFTGVAVAQLAQNGRLSFTNTVCMHLPNYPNKAVAEKVTIHHLLTHTGGLGSYFNNEFMQSSRERFRTIDDFMPLMVNEPLLFEPGERWSYSNSGFLLLGKLIEQITGQSYFDYVREHIYQPAGMFDTDAYEMDDDSVQNLAMGYTRFGLPAGQRRNNIFLHSFKGGPAGGGFSTVEDLFKFSLALQNHTLLDPSHTTILLEGKVQDGPDPASRYAYGFEDNIYYGERVVGHGGGFMGINSKLDIYPDSGYTVAIMSNYDPMAAEGVASHIRKLLTGTPLLQPVELHPSALQLLLGSYEMLEGPMPDLKLTVEMPGNQLECNFRAMGRFEMLALDQNTFFDEETTDQRFVFQRDEQGQVTGLEIRTGRDIMSFKKAA